MWTIFRASSGLVRTIEDRVDDLVAQAKVDRQLQQLNPQETEAVWSDKQNSLAALKSDWARVKNLAKCLDRQMEHQSNYHLFYQTLKEYQSSLEAAFASFRTALAGQNFSGTKDEAKWLFEQMQSLITAVLQWWQRIDSLIIQSRKVLPMAARLGPLDMKRPGKVLVDFETKELTLKANDDVFVVDTSDRDSWTVETTRGQSISLPSMCIAISGPDPEVMERSLSVRTFLLADWTATLREVGRALVSFTLSVFRLARTAEVDLPTEDSLDGRELEPLLGVMEKLLQTYWAKNPEFSDMAERISKARVSLAIYDDAQDIDDCTHIDINTLFLQLSPLAITGSNSEESGGVTQKMLTLLMRKYQELLKYWEVYKVLVETSNDPNYFWMMEEFQKLRYINVTELLNFLASEDKETWLHYIHQMMSRSSRGRPEPVVTPVGLEQDLDMRPEDSLRLMEPAPSLASGASSRVLIDATDGRTFVQPEQKPQVGREVTAELIVSDPDSTAENASNGDAAPEQPEQQASFISTASLQVNLEEAAERPPTPAGSEVSAVSSGVRQRVAALGRSVSNASSVKEATASPVRSAEVEEFKRDEVEENSRMVISGVVDTLDGTMLSMQDAIERGIIHSESGSYLNRAKNVWIPIPVAVAEGLIQVERRTEERQEVKKQQVYGILTIKGGGGGGRPSFVVTAVHDKLRRSKLTLAEAQQSGLADDSLTKFLDTERDEWLELSSAADRGLIEYDVGPASGGGDSSDGGEVSYVVYSVVDVAGKTSVSFKEARERGLINAEDGAFVNNATGERLELEDAVKRGFLKADRVTGPVSQVAGAEERVVVNRLRNAKSRMRGAVRAMRGFGGN
uniref:SH3_10 domain-containing protein n=1 Tax=Macrostomum lignano TaxID=282301 RepID=A0A1I8GRI7_9PLAT